jgi:type III secretory pathway component EscS
MADSGEAAGGIMVLLLMAIPWIIGLAGTVFMIVALVDAIRVRSDSEYRVGTKVIWVLVILLLHCVGALIYWFVGRPRTRA